MGEDLMETLFETTSAKNSELFASKVCTTAVLQNMLSDTTFQEYHQAYQGIATISKGAAQEIAEAMKEWALSNGATHYCHWFQPWTGYSAEKHDSFLSWADDGMLIETFSGSSLIMGEPDASSLPSGGLRNTYEARGYTSWDPSSPAFIWNVGNASVLCIPSIFFSYNGEALDTKIPLLRSDAKLARVVRRLLQLLGEEATDIYSTLGCEQEYFLIDEQMCKLRRDLAVSGTTVHGAPPSKGQELEDHYFGTLKSRVLEFMDDFERQALALGIPVKTRHNEVAPAQHEVAPLFEKVTLGVDHNILLMQLMKKVAEEHGLRCLLHEKPFERINGSGKHLNWSLSTTNGQNLLDPGTTPRENTRFLLLIAAVLEGINAHPLLLRASIGSFSNDKRLGGNEAPPGILSVYLGETLDALLTQIEKESDDTSKKELKLDLGLQMLPELFKHDTDRNRTSPFAFTGNKFEFRACGSAHSPSFPMTVLNAIVAEALEKFCDQLESGKSVREILKDSVTKTKRIRFLGDNYSEEWREEAKSRKLPETHSSYDAFNALLFEETRDVFSHILTKIELDSVYEVLCSGYTKHKAIERKLLIEICETQLIPAAFSYQKECATSIQSVEAIAPDAMPIQKRQLRRYASLLSQILESLNALKLDPENDETANVLRDQIDTLEQSTGDSLWPVPKYWELLFSI